MFIKSIKHFINLPIWKFMQSGKVSEKFCIFARGMHIVFHP